MKQKEAILKNEFSTLSTLSSDLQTDCHFCGERRLELIHEFSSLRRITSDCKPWPSGGQMAVCERCGFPQTVVTEKWRGEVEKIYRDYTIYFQSEGHEQRVFDAKTGQAMSRSERLVRCFWELIRTPSRGSLLDVGCGNGAFLEAVSEVAPEWNLFGSEVDEKYATKVKSIPGVREHYSGPLSGICAEFEIVTLIHVLEHIPNPRQYLAELCHRIKMGGYLLIQVPDCVANPFMILVADHCAHFSLGSLQELVQSLGFSTVHASNQWVTKEISLVVRKTNAPLAMRALLNKDQVANIIKDYTLWLNQLVVQSRVFAQTGRTGIFGTSVAGSWLFEELAELIEFFVDEDPSRIGKLHHDRRIFSPLQLQQEDQVIYCLPPALAQQIDRRLTEIKFRRFFPNNLPV